VRPPWFRLVDALSLVPGGTGLYRAHLPGVRDLPAVRVVPAVSGLWERRFRSDARGAGRAQDCLRYVQGRSVW